MDLVNFTIEEHTENLKRLGINQYSELVGKDVCYSQPAYGKHRVTDYDDISGEYELCIGSNKFKSNPFRILLLPKPTIKDVIDYIKNDAEIAIPIERLMNEDGSHLTKRDYGLVLLDVLCEELRKKFL